MESNLILNTSNTIYIPKDVYDSYASNFYDERHVELFNIQFKSFFNRVWKKLEILLF